MRTVPLVSATLELLIGPAVAPLLSVGDKLEVESSVGRVRIVPPVSDIPALLLLLATGTALMLGTPEKVVELFNTMVVEFEKKLILVPADIIVLILLAMLDSEEPGGGIPDIVLVIGIPVLEDNGSRVKVLEIDERLPVAEPVAEELVGKLNPVDPIRGEVGLGSDPYG